MRCGVAYEAGARSGKGGGGGMKRERGNSGERYREERAREEGSSSFLSRSGHEGWL